MKPRSRFRLLAPLVLPLVVGFAAVAAASAFDAVTIRIALQCVAIAAATVMACRAGVLASGASERSATGAASPERIAAFTVDRRRPTFDRETGLYATWYFRLRVEEEIARAARYATPFTLLCISSQSPVALNAPRMAIKHWLRQIDFAGDLGNVIAVLLPNTNRAGAAIVLERISKLVTGVDLRLAEYPADGTTAAQLFGDDEWRVSEPGEAEAA